ncbi:MAG: phage portal protein [Pseudomonadota bacterium]
MGLLQRLLRRRGSAGESRWTDLSWEGLQHGAPVGGARPDQLVSALSVAARCVSLRSEALASIPLHLYRRLPDGGRERATDHPLYRVLHDSGNSSQTAFEVREMICRSLDTAGNAYCTLERNGQGAITAIWPVPPQLVSVERLQNRRLRYRVSEPNGSTQVLTQEEVLHLRGPSRDGVLGQSPLQLSNGALGLALSYAVMAEAYANNSLRPSGLMVANDRISSPEMKKQLMRDVERAFAGINNAGRVIITDLGIDFKAISHTPESAELLGSRKLSNEDVARAFGLPPTSVGITDKATYSNVEQEARALVQNALAPLAARIEAGMMRTLLTERGRRNLYIEHDLSGLLRGDVATRYQAYATGRQWGWLSPNDVRQLENMPPIDGGDEYLRPMNMAPLGTPAEGAATTEES